MSSMPMYFPDGFDHEKSVTCAKLVETAYDMYTQWVNQGKPHQDKFNWQPNWPSDLEKFTFSDPLWSDEKILWIIPFEVEPFAFVATNDSGEAYLVFRGTESCEDWITDAEASEVDYELAPGFGKVHKGFYNLYKTMNQVVLDALQKISAQRLYVSSHSLGGALSTLALPAIINDSNLGFTPENVRHYPLASPRVGSPEFATAYNDSGVPTFRVVNTCDIVPEVPPSVALGLVYQHVGTPVDYTAQYRTVGGNHSITGSYLYALQHPDKPWDPSTK